MEDGGDVSLYIIDNEKNSAIARPQVDLCRFCAAKLNEFLKNAA